MRALSLAASRQARGKVSGNARALAARFAALGTPWADSVSAQFLGTFLTPQKPCDEGERAHWCGVPPWLPSALRHRSPSFPFLSQGGTALPSFPLSWSVAVVLLARGRGSAGRALGLVEGLRQEQNTHTHPHTHTHPLTPAGALCPFPALASPPASVGSGIRSARGAPASPRSASPHQLPASPDAIFI